MPEQLAVKRVWVPQNDDERFDHVVVKSTERWKESELSGDEWRFTFQAFFYSHGVLMMTRGGASIQDCLVSASHWYSNPRKSLDEDEETRAKWEAAKADVEERCAQPRCPEFWTVLYHPIKKYTQSGRQDGEHYDYRKGSNLNWLAVRGFCDKHRHRGDCDLEDADTNYELIEERIPPGWLNT